MAVAVELLLQSFVAKDDPSFVLPLIGNYNLCMVVHAWPLCGVKWNPPSSLESGVVPERDADLWRLLWSWCEWDKFILGRIVGVRIEIVSLVSRAIDLRLIYPDGSISPSAEKYLRTVVGKEIMRLVGTKKNEV